MSGCMAREQSLGDTKQSCKEMYPKWRPGGVERPVDPCALYVDTACPSPTLDAVALTLFLCQTHQAISSTTAGTQAKTRIVRRSGRVSARSGRTRAAKVRCISSMILSSLSADQVCQECWNSPVHTGLSLPVMAWKPRKRRGSVACRQKASKDEAL
jgi:hypothetical protein